MSENSPKSWFAKLKIGLTKTSNKLASGISAIFTKKKLDKEALRELEDLLIESDIGVKTASYIVSELAKGRFDKEVELEEIKQELANIVTSIIAPIAKPIEINSEYKPHVILVCGVNGNGKTTTIGKLASYYQAQGKKIALAACDTFRAAAVEQLAVWAARNNCQIFRGVENADPASVAYNALQLAQKDNIDILFVDTAGRLHNKAGLMEELAKIIRVMKKLDENAPHDVLLVLDATTGQNANSQVEIFKNIVGITGLIITKLDGTAKAGVLVNIAQNFALPVHAIGVGEAIEDLRPFNAEDFANNLVGVEKLANLS